MRVRADISFDAMNKISCSEEGQGAGLKRECKSDRKYAPIIF